MISNHDLQLTRLFEAIERDLNEEELSDKVSKKLKAALADEKKAAKDYAKLIALAEKEGDSETKSMIEEIMKDEEDHAKKIEARLGGSDVPEDDGEEPKSEDDGEEEPEPEDNEDEAE